jgi:hypothetical protein
MKRIFRGSRRHVSPGRSIGRALRHEPPRQYEVQARVVPQKLTIGHVVAHELRPNGSYVLETPDFNAGID